MNYFSAGTARGGEKEVEWVDTTTRSEEETEGTLPERQIGKGTNFHTVWLFLVHMGVIS